MVIALGMYLMQGNYLLAPNQSNSMAGSWYLIDLKPRTQFVPGDKVAFVHEDKDRGIPATATWLKNIRGLPGEKITTTAAQVVVGGRDGGTLNYAVMDEAELSAVTVTSVPAQHYYVTGEHARSFDSRYAEFGFVAFSQVIGKAYLIW